MTSTGQCSSGAPAAAVSPAPSQLRHPKTFAGLRNDDVEDWLDVYERRSTNQGPFCRQINAHWSTRVARAVCHKSQAFRGEFSERGFIFGEAVARPCGASVEGPFDSALSNDC
ncbi:hypothetical protein ISCGN_015181 [Ixodes scapularis]